MKITILNGAFEDSGTIEEYLEKLVEFLSKMKNEIQYFKLRDLEIKQCMGCFGCWVETPGECIVPDDTVKIRRAAVNSDLLIFASPLILGFTTSILKKAIDKMIPIVHPYFTIRAGEIHHKKRYKTYPLLGVLIEKEIDTDKEDLEIVRAIYERVAIEMATSLVFFDSDEKPPEEVAYAITNH
ncbi:flavodoxin family protein [Mesotoga sp.]|uniref:flavodoxin family protein n=1 Tax=Mesotoga sp. TaxID=2053577 RepID=UPI001BD655AB|nr:flavodoxin family protein [Mesotoga sp.]MDD3461462.1 flavodoxin family protein [Mesotoga sp.]